jgi:ABC-type multidrug transport system fused ATPase/permease subunit
MYKNFFHFNFHKVIIFLVAILYAIIAIIPFYFISFLLNNYFSSFSANIIVIIFTFIWYLLIFSAFTFYYPLLIKLDLNYEKRKKISIKENNYFNLKFFIAYIKLFLLNI